MSNQFSPYEIALNEYFTLKNNYDKKILKDKRNIWSNYSKKNIKTSKKAIKDFKGKCISCKRKVNTIFENKNGIYSAKCGDQDKPCSLNIQLQKPQYSNLFDLLEIFRKDIENNQTEIIKLKYNMLFELLNNDDYIEIFENINTEYKNNNTTYNSILDIINTNILEQNENNQHNNLLNKKVLLNISKMKELLKEFNENPQNNYFIKDAISLYIKEIFPIYQEIRNNKSKNHIIDIVLTENNFIYSNDNNYNEDDKLIHYKCIPYNKNIQEYLIQESKIISNKK
jgi:hypothetical protein